MKCPTCLRGIPEWSLPSLRRGRAFRGMPSMLLLFLLSMSSLSLNAQYAFENYSSTQIEITSSDLEVCFQGAGTTLQLLSSGYETATYQWYELGAEGLDASSVNSSGSSPSISAAWQSFTTGASGLLSSISLEFVAGSGSKNLSIYKGEGIAGTLIHTQSFTLTNTSLNIALDYTIPVSSGEVFTLYLHDGTGSFELQTGSTYAGGRADYSAGEDYLFSIYLRSIQTLNGATNASYSPSTATVGTSHFLLIASLAGTDYLSNLSGVIEVLPIPVNSLAPAVGDGTELNPFEINSLNNLVWVSEDAARWSYHYRQTANIDASSTANQCFNEGAGWLPIGDATVPFTGSWKGQFRTISNLYANRPASNNIGLFGKTQGATIQDLQLPNASMSGLNWVGIVVGHHGTNSLVRSVGSSGTVTGNQFVGGIVGDNRNGATVDQAVSSASVSGVTFVGGLAGANNTGSIISNSYCASNVTRLSGDDIRVGAFVGENYNSQIVHSYTSVANVYYSGAENPTNDGFVGKDLTGSYSNNFHNATLSNQTSAIGATTLTATSLQEGCTFINAGWDFAHESINGTSDYWGINAVNNNAYPFLAWQGFTPSTTPCCIDPNLAGVVSHEAFVYDFEGIAANSAVNNLDNWKVVTSGGASVNALTVLENSDQGWYAGSKALSANLGGSQHIWGTRVNDANFSLPTFSGSDFWTLEFDMDINYWGNRFALGFDENNNGHLAASEISFALYGSRYSGEIQLQGAGGSVLQSLSLATGGNLFRFRIQVDMAANAGAGSISVSYLDLSGKGTWVSPASLQDISAGWNPLATNHTNPTRINAMLYDQEAGDRGYLDNIRVYFNKQRACSQSNTQILTSLLDADFYIGTLEYQWQESTTGPESGFVDINGANSSTYQPTNLTQNTWYRRLARVACSADWSGAIATPAYQIELVGYSIYTDGNKLVYTDECNSSESLNITQEAGGIQFDVSGTSVSLNHQSVQPFPVTIDVAGFDSLIFQMGGGSSEILLGVNSQTALTGNLPPIAIQSAASSDLTLAASYNHALTDSAFWSIEAGGSLEIELQTTGNPINSVASADGDITLGTAGWTSNGGRVEWSGNNLTLAQNGVKTGGGKFVLTANQTIILDGNTHQTSGGRFSATAASLTIKGGGLDTDGGQFLANLTGSMLIQADGLRSGGGNIQAGGTSLTFSDTYGMNTEGGNCSLAFDSMILNGYLYTEGGDLSANGGSLLTDGISSANGNILLNFTGDVQIQNGGVSKGTGTFTSVGNHLSIDGAGLYGTIGDITFSHTGNVTILGAGIVSGGGNIVSLGVDFNSLAPGGISSGGGNITLNHSGNVVMDCNPNATNAGILTSGGNLVSIGNAFNLLCGPLVTGAGSVTIDHDGDVNILYQGITTESGSVVLIGDNLAVAGAGIVTAGGSVTLAFTGDVSIDGNGIDTNGGYLGSAGSDLSLGAFTAGLRSDGGNIQLYHPGSITVQSGGISSGGGSIQIQGGSLTSSGAGIYSTTAASSGLIGIDLTGYAIIRDAGIASGSHSFGLECNTYALFEANITSSAISVAAGTSLTINASAQLTASSGNIELQSGSSLTMTNGTAISASLGTVTLRATNDIELTTVSSTAENISIQSISGHILRNPLTLFNNVSTAGKISFLASNGIGWESNLIESDRGISFTAGQVEASSSQGGIVLYSMSNVECLSLAVSSGSDSIYLNALGDITISGNIDAPGKLYLEALSGNDVLLGNTTITLGQTNGLAMEVHAGKIVSAGSAAGGQVKASANTLIQFASLSAQGRIYTGNRAASTGLLDLVSPENTRYYVDASTTSFSPTLGNGLYLLFREKPADVSWVGISSDWNSHSNWNPAFVPSDGTNVTISSASVYPIISSGTVHLNDLNIQTNSAEAITIQPGVQLTISGNLNLTSGGSVKVIAAP